MSFYSIGSKDVADQLQAAFCDYQYSDSKSNGFVTDVIDPDQSRFQFIRRLEISEEYFTPDGMEIKNERVVFEVVLIRILRDDLVLEISDPGRGGGSAMFKQIIDLTGVDLRLTQLKPNFPSLFNSFKSANEEFEILRVETKRFLIKGRTSCQVKFSALVDVRNDVDYFLSSREYGIASARVHFKGLGQTIDIFDTGRLLFNFDQTLERNFRTLKVLLSGMS